MKIVQKWQFAGPNSDHVRWTHADRLGSMIGLTDAAGALREKLAYDAWGKRRTSTGLPTGGSATPDTINRLTDNRGFTNHEMLDQLDLVHMNGRVYEPMIKRFLSGDPLVSDPMNGQQYNRYSYVLNNPTNITDPSGFYAVDSKESNEITIRGNVTGSHIMQQTTLACNDCANVDVGALGKALGYFNYTSKETSNSKSPAPASTGGSANKVSDESVPPPPTPSHPISVTNERAANAEYSTVYTTKLLSRDVGVDIASSSSQNVDVLSNKLDSAINLINDNSKYLSKEELRIIREINGFYVRDNIRTGMNMDTGIYNLRASYIIASPTVWLSSTIAHDSFHIEQRRQGYFYNRLSAPRMEMEANRFQIQVGRKLGLPESSVDYIKNDTHTLYNTSAY